MTLMIARSRQVWVLVLTLLVAITPLQPSGLASVQTPVPPVAGGDVTMFRGDAARTGAMPGPGLSGQPELLWRLETASQLPSTPAIVDGVAYFGDGILGGGGLRAVDTASGLELWAAGLPGQPFGSSPAVVEGMAFIGDLEGNVTGVDVATEEVSWSAQLGGDITSSPAVVDSTLFIRNGMDVLFALDARTGEERWRFATGGDGGYTFDTAPAVVDGVVYMTTIDSDREDSLFALDAESGEELWSFAPGSSGLNTPAVVDGVIYAGGDGGMYAVDAASGDQIWNAPVGEVFSAPAVTAGLVVVHTRQNLVSVDAATGEERWRYDTGGSWSAPTVVDGIVYVGSQAVGRNGLHLVDATSGQLIWHVRAIGSMNASPVVTGGVVYAGSNDGLFAFGSASAPTATPEGRRLTTIIGQFTFASEVDPNGDPLDAGSRLPSGITTLLIVYDFAGVPEGATSRIVWLLDGEPIYEDESAWELGRDGQATQSISANDGVLPDGTYEVILYFDGVELRRGTVTVGGN